MYSLHLTKIRIIRTHCPTLHPLRNHSTYPFRMEYFMTPFIQFSLASLPSKYTPQRPSFTTIQIYRKRLHFCVLKFLNFDSWQEDKLFWREFYLEIPEFSLLLTSSWGILIRYCFFPISGNFPYKIFPWVWSNAFLCGRNEFEGKCNIEHLTKSSFYLNTYTTSGFTWWPL
jgi:hypothetical protein